jgi:hypothetical protein
MLLREFELDAAHVDKATRARFRLQTRGMAALYERCFPGMKTKDVWKMSVECVPSVCERSGRNLLGVMVIQETFDVTKFFELDDLQKRKSAISTLHVGLTRAAGDLALPLEPFEQARECVIRAEYKNEWVWNKPKASPTRQFRAHLWCAHSVDAFLAWLVVESKSGQEIARRKVVETPPDEFQFGPMLGALKWTSPDRVALVSKDGRVVESVAVVYH